MRKGVVITLCVIIVSAVFVSLCYDFSTRKTYARTAEFHVVIDAGHGGRDGGAISPKGTYEANINLQIAKYLRTELQSLGIGVTLTRENENSLANPYASNQKKSDMEERRKIIEKVQPDLVVSIHLNSLPSHPSVRGLQSFYAKNADPKFANAIQDEFNSSNLCTNRRATVGDYFMLNCTSFPSVLLECGFLSNPNDERLLKSPDYQKLLAVHIAKAISSASV